MNKFCRTALTYPCRLGFETLKPIYQHVAGPDRLRLVVVVEAGYGQLADGPRWHAAIVRYEPADHIVVEFLKRLCDEALIGAGEGASRYEVVTGNADYMKDGIVRLRQATFVHSYRQLSADEFRSCGGAIDIRGDSSEIRRRVMEGLQYAPPAIVHRELRQIEQWVFEARLQS